MGKSHVTLRCQQDQKMTRAPQSRGALGTSPLRLHLLLYFFRSLQDAAARGCQGLSTWCLVTTAATSPPAREGQRGSGMPGRAWTQAPGELVSQPAQHC